MSLYMNTSATLLLLGPWLLYSAVIPLAPLALVLVGGYLLPNKKQPFFDIIRDGQVFFFCTATIAFLVRDLAKTQVSGAGLTFGFLGLLLLVFSVLFGFVVMNKDDVDKSKVGWMSIFSVIGVIALVSGIRVSEKLL